MGNMIKRESIPKTRAILNYDGHVEPRPYIDSQLSVAENKLRESKTVKIENIPVKANKQDVIQASKSFGKAIKLWMKITDSQAAVQKKDCFLMFEKAESASNFIISGDMVRICEESVKINFPNKEGESLKKSAFIGNLDPEATEKDLRQLFAGTTRVEHAKVIRDLKTGISHKIGFVRFESEEDTLKGLELNNTIFMKRRVRIVRNQMNPQEILKELAKGMTEKMAPMTKEEVELYQNQASELSKAKNPENIHYGITMMENLIKHQGKVPSSIIGKKIKKLKKQNLSQDVLAKKN